MFNVIVTRKMQIKTLTMRHDFIPTRMAITTTTTTTTKLALGGWEDGEIGTSLGQCKNGGL